MKLATFNQGGIHPPENKISASAAIKDLGLPQQVTIHLSQHLGAPAQPMVEKGDKVKAGTLIGKAASFISANIHSSVSGTVTKVDAVSDISGYKKPAVIIKVEGDEWEESIDRSTELKKEINLDPNQIVERISAAGIVGMGGACFPANVKYMVPEGKNIDTLIINGVECEPYLTADHRLMLEEADKLLVGVEVLKRAAGVDKAYIGIEANKPDAIRHLEEKARGYNGTIIIPLRVQYPQGAEKQLIGAITGREVPSGKLPIDVGCIVNNVGTTVAIYEAVQKNKPLFERATTMTGKGLRNPGNFKVRVGTPISALVEACGGLPEDTGKIISGGPMMGKAISTLDVPVAKGTSGVVVLSQKEGSRARVHNCIRCGKCVTVCPMGLEPYYLEKAGAHEQWEECETAAVFDCIECGSCSYTCPSARPLLDYIRHAKVTVMGLMRARSSK